MNKKKGKFKMKNTKVITEKTGKKILYKVYHSNDGIYKNVLKEVRSFYELDEFDIDDEITIVSEINPWKSFEKAEKVFEKKYE